MTEAQGAVNPRGATIAMLAWWTIIDECRPRTVGLLVAVGVMFLVGMRGCAQSSVVVNGESINAATLVAQATFHGLAAGVLLVAALRAMRLFQREREDGTQAYVLSRPVARWQYLVGRVAGLWLVSAAGMLAFHAALFLMTVAETHAGIPAYVMASLLCSVDLLLVILAVLALSLWLPDFLAFLAVMGLTVVSFVGRGLEAAVPLVHRAMPLADASSAPGLPWWKMAWLVWPKLGGVQISAASLIGPQPVSAGALVDPLVNVVVYSCIFAMLCSFGFSRTEIV